MHSLLDLHKLEDACVLVQAWKAVVLFCALGDLPLVGEPRGLEGWLVARLYGLFAFLISECKFLLSSFGFSFFIEPAFSLLLTEQQFLYFISPKRKLFTPRLFKRRLFPFPLMPQIAMTPKHRLPLPTNKISPQNRFPKKVFRQFGSAEH